MPLYLTSGYLESAAYNTQTRLSRILHNRGSVNTAALFYCRLLRFSFYMTTQIMIVQSIYSAHKNCFLTPNFPMRPTFFANLTSTAVLYERIGKLPKSCARWSHTLSPLYRTCRFLMTNKQCNIIRLPLYPNFAQNFLYTSSLIWRLFTISGKNSAHLFLKINIFSHFFEYSKSMKQHPQQTQHSVFLKRWDNKSILLIQVNLLIKRYRKYNMEIFQHICFRIWIDRAYFQFIYTNLFVYDGSTDSFKVIETQLIIHENIYFTLFHMHPKRTAYKCFFLIITFQFISINENIMKMHFKILMNVFHNDVLLSTNSTEHVSRFRFSWN